MLLRLRLRPQTQLEKRRARKRRAVARKRRAVNKHGLQLTKSGRVAGSAISINAKYDSAYRNAENDKCGPGWCWISSDTECPEVPCSVHDKSQNMQNIQNIHIEKHI
jgi:hypothetical protein